MQQSPLITIDSETDFITDSGIEVWNILEQRDIEHVVVCGVHTNMCVLGRPFGLRQLAQHGKHVVLLRDLTDTMYNPASWPFVNHFSGTDLIIDHVERFVCPTTTSDQFFHAAPFRFSADKRPHLVMLIAEDEYQTADTLIPFAAAHLRKDFRISVVHSDAKDLKRLPGLETIRSADAILVSVRRRPLAADQLKLIRDYVATGKPVIGIRTASHAFCLRDGATVPETEQWPEFDAQVFGGNYSNHYGNELHPKIDSILLRNHVDPMLFFHLSSFQSNGSLYKVSPLAASTQTIVTGQIDHERIEPVAWTNIRADSGRSFYTSLGHPDDFNETAFRALLLNGIHWAMDMPLVNQTSIQKQWQAYKDGSGKQRK